MPRTTRRSLVLAAVMLAMFMAAIEGTIISTAMPNIVGDLGGFSYYSWVFSIFLLTQSVTIPIYGKLADLFGRKLVFAIGTGLFLLGSLLCGLAQSMMQLVVFRALQGIGAGAVQPIATTVIGDIYSLEERGKVQAYVSSVWGISAIIGPALGGLLVQYVHWAWVFWMNLPLGILAILGFFLFLREDVEKKRRRIDYLGSGFLLIFSSCLIVVFIQGGVAWSWLSGPSLFLITVCLIGFCLFLWQESRFPEPMMPLYLWRHRLITLANLVSLLNGMAIIGLSAFLPAYVQGVMGRSAITAGFTLAVMSVGWPIAGAVAGRILLRIGFRSTALFGACSLILGSVWFVTLSAEKGPLWAGIGSFFVGVGLGFLTTTFIVAIQSSVDWNLRGVATASNMFMRILGSTIGAALLGGILNVRLLGHLKQSGMEVELPRSLDAGNILLNPEHRSTLSPEALELLREAMAVGVHSVYWVTLIIALASFLLVLWLPRGRERLEKVQLRSRSS